MIVACVLCLSIFSSCNGETDIPETTVTLSAYVVEDGEIVFSELREGKRYILAEVPDKDGKSMNSKSLTVSSNGTICVICEKDMCFVTGEAKDNLLIKWDGYLDMLKQTVTAYRNTTFTYAFVAQEHEPHFGASNGLQYMATDESAPRQFIISVWEGDNPRLSGDPRIIMTAELTYQTPTNNHECGYILEILSIEHKPSADW